MQTTYTSDQVSVAVNAAAKTVLADLGLGEREEDLLDLVAELTVSKLERPSATLDESIEENTERSPSEVRAWWGNWK